MQRSDSIANLAAALCKAQCQIKPAIKDSTNPFFKSKYADFGAVLDACEDALADNGLCIVQAPISDEHGAGVETMLLHESGEFLSERLILTAAKEDAQGMGSCITYARRYALEGFLRIRREDDDGNAAAQSLNERRESTSKAEQLRKDAEAAAMKILSPAAENGHKDLELAWKALSKVMRDACVHNWGKLKERAQEVDAKKGPTTRGKDHGEGH